MKSNLKSEGKEQAKLTVTVDSGELAALKQQAVAELGKDVATAGFRKGKAPARVVEQQIDEKHLQAQVLEEAVNKFYVVAVNEHSLRVIDHPQIAVKKYVPYDTLEFEATVNVLPPIKLADYHKIKVSPDPVKITDDEVNEVLANLQNRTAKRSPVEREAKTGDELIIDFTGKDKDGKSVSGASGKDYPLLLGSQKFIPGFEEALEGVKTGATKTFPITFPKDYGHKPLANAKVTFTVVVKSVNEVAKPELDDAFASQVGPFKDLAALKEDVKRQLEAERRHEAENQLKDKIMGKIIEGSTIPTPDSLVADQSKIILDDFKRNLTYRGITLEEYLTQSNLTEEDFHKKELKPQAERRVKVGLALSEIADKEGIDVTDEELELRLTLLRQQYKDPSVQANFDQPDAQRDVRSRLLTEKTLNKLVEITSN